MDTQYIKSFNDTRDMLRASTARKLTLTGKESAYQVARKVLNHLLRDQGINPDHAYAFGDNAGGNQSRTRKDMTLRNGYGYYAPDPGTGGAQVCAEDADYEWAIGWCAGVQDAIDQAGLPLFAEPACGFALNIHPIPCRFCGKANATTIIKETNHLGHWEHELCQSCVETRPRS